MAKNGAIVGLVGAGSLVGRELLELLAEVPAVSGLRPLSEKAAGTSVTFRGRELTVDDLDDAGLSGLTAAVFCPGEKRSRRWAKVAADRGAAVIDLSSSARLDPAIPLLGSGPPATPSGGQLLSVPSAAALTAARVMVPLAEGGPRALTATLLVPASGAGARGVQELSRQTAALLGSRQARAKRFPHRLAFNIVPEVRGLDGPDDRAELSFAAELRRLLGAPELSVAATALRVPVFFGLCAALTLELARPLDAGRARELLSGVKGAQLIDDPARHLYPMASLAAGYDGILVGRVRGQAARLSLFAAADPLKLVARAAVQAVTAALR